MTKRGNPLRASAPKLPQASSSITNPLKAKSSCSSSGPHEGEAQIVDDIAKEFSDKGLIVLAVDVLEPDQKVKKYIAEHPRSVPIVLTKDTNLAAMYNAQVYPIYVVIDRDGNIAGEQRGAAGDRGIRRLLRSAGLKSEE